MSTSEQRFYQQRQLQLQEEQLKLAKLSVVEPAKNAESAMKGAADATVRAAQLRRGIASTFSRRRGGSAAPSSSATSGSSTKLGG